MKTYNKAYEASTNADLFISIGTSGVVYPAANIPLFAKNNEARMIEINPEVSIVSQLFDEHIRKSSSEALFDIFVS